jgi:hypothetical protein
MLEIAHAASWVGVFNDDYATRRGRSEHYRMRVASIDGVVLSASMTCPSRIR